MEYRFTDADKATVTVDLTLGDVAELRGILSAVLDGKTEDVSRWSTKAFVRKLAEAQAKAAEIMATEAQALAEKAKLPDHL
jgi:hypothetical protein